MESKDSSVEESHSADASSVEPQVEVQLLSSIESLYSNPVLHNSHDDDVNYNTVFPLNATNIITLLQYSVWPQNEPLKPRIEIECRWFDVGTEILAICPRKVEEITRGCTSDGERVKTVIEFWLTWFPYASWRWLVEWAGWNGAFRDDDKIVCRQYCEPLNDSNLTIENVTAVFHEIIKIDNLFISPLKFLQMDGLSSYEEYLKRKAILWLSISPNANWEDLAGELYNLNETDALETVLEFLKEPDPSLTLDNLKSILSPVKNLPGLAKLLCIPTSKYQRLKMQHPQHSQYLDALICEFLDNHPAPTWKRVANALYEMAYDDKNCYRILEVIHRKYISRGLSLQALCVDAVCKYIDYEPHKADLLPLPTKFKTRMKSHHRNRFQ